MTDISKYKNVSLPKDTYNKIDKIRKVMIPEMTISPISNDYITSKRESQKTKWKTRKKLKFVHVAKVTDI